MGAESNSFMRVVITENTTVDGVIDLADGWFAPASGAEEEADHLAVLREQDRTADAMLLGRQTFEDFRGYWPRQVSDPTGISGYLNRVTKLVISKTLREPGWENTVVLRGPVDEEVHRLKDQPGQDVVCTGSVRLARTLVEAGLVDEYRLFVHPAVQGRGRRLFPDGHRVSALRLLEVRAFRSGTALQRYAAVRGV